MSRDIVEIICRYSISSNQGLMIVASRNQVDHHGYYSCSTEQLASDVKKSGAKIILCRDHCGPYFKDSDQGLSIEQAMQQCIETIDTDIQHGFDLIHIDPSRIHDNPEKHARILIEHAISKNPKIMIEYGSEEIHGKASIDEVVSRDLRFVEPYRENVRFIVAHTGSLVKDRQVGQFDAVAARRLSAMIHASGYLFKEHNADYLTREEVRCRWENGVDAMNIAPQLGALQTWILQAHCHQNQLSELWDQFAKEVVDGGYWHRWISAPDSTEDWKAVIAGHYHQKSSLFEKIRKTNQPAYQSLLQQTVVDLLSDYTGDVR